MSQNVNEEFDERSGAALMKLIGVDGDTVNIELSLDDLKDIAAVLSLADATMDATGAGIEDDRLSEINDKVHGVTIEARELKLKIGGA